MQYLLCPRPTDGAAYPGHPLPVDRLSYSLAVNALVEEDHLATRWLWPTTESERSTMHRAHIKGWGKYVPPPVMTNRDLALIVETNDEWIRTRTGIVERHVAG